MFKVQMPVGNMPINLVLLSNGQIAFVRVGNFKALFDQGEAGGVSAVFYEEDFSIGKETYQYNTAYPYKEISDMLTWLQAQALIKPTVQHI